MTEKQTIAIIGASGDRNKYGNKAVRGFAAAGYEVYPVNPTESEIEGLQCYQKLGDVPVKVDIITLYTPPIITLKLIGALAESGCEEIYMNPGTEDEKVRQASKKAGLNPIFACSVVARAFFVSEE